MLRFIVYAVPLLILLLALFGFTVELLDAEPRSGSVIKLALFEQPRVPGKLVIGAWLVEASGLIALFLLAQGRFAAWWLDGLVAGWVAWVFRGPLLVITIVVAARQPQDPWWKLAFGWWVLYSVCGLSLAILARRSGLASWTADDRAGVESNVMRAPEVATEVEQADSDCEPVEAEVETGESPADESSEAETEPEEVAPAAEPDRRAEAEPEKAETESPEPVTDSEQLESALAPEPEEAATPVVEASEAPVAKTAGPNAGKE